MDVKGGGGGQYRVMLEYGCRPENVGAMIRVEIGSQSIERIVDKAHEAPTQPSADRQKRGEVYERAWGQLTVGTVELVKGRTKLLVRAVSKHGDQVMELKAVKLERVSGRGYDQIVQD